MKLERKVKTKARYSPTLRTDKISFPNTRRIVPQESNFYEDNSVRYAEEKTEQSVKHTAEDMMSSMRKGRKDIVRSIRKHHANTMKTAKNTVKTAKHTAKTTAKATKKTAEASAKAAKASAKAAEAAAKAASAAGKAVAKVVVKVIKAIIEGIKELIALIIAGGWISVIIIAVIAVVIALMAIFGVFSSNESTDGSKPMTEAIEQINSEYTKGIEKRIRELSRSDVDKVEIIYEGDMESAESTVPNWADVISVYSVKYAMDEENPMDVTAITEENIQALEMVFNDMNEVSYRTSRRTEEILAEDPAAEPETKTILSISINTTSLDYRDGAELYGFNADQNEILAELMQPEFYPLFAELIGETIGDGGEYGMGLYINPDLPPNTLGAQIVEAAKRYIGRSYSSMDCSNLVRTALKDCGLNSMNGINSTAMAKKCQDMGILFTDASELQAGDLIFFARKNPSKGEGYCTDTRRCGSGKCKRWMQIHHVAIYINDDYLIDSTGGKNSVQIRKHWGINGSEWSWVCFGRVTE